MVELGTGLPRWGLVRSEHASSGVLKECHLMSVNGRGLVRKASESGGVAVRLS